VLHPATVGLLRVRHAAQPDGLDRLSALRPGQHQDALDIGVFVDDVIAQLLVDVSQQLSLQGYQALCARATGLNEQANTHQMMRHAGRVTFDDPANDWPARCAGEKRLRTWVVAATCQRVEEKLLVWRQIR
jgi:hypothetical protein